jgi:hypothetical protein
LFALLLLALPAGSLAAERDRTFELHPTRSRNRTAATTSAADDAKVIARLIDDINAAVRTDKRRILSIITINTDVAATTLEEQKARTGLTLGDIYVAHSLALSTRKKFDTIIALKKGGQTWAQIARAHKVRLMGSKALLEEMKRK